METHDLRAVIEEPAALPDVQLTFEGNLVGDLLFETQGQIGALPLLEFTLDQLFQQREGQIVTLDAYRRLGGVKGALVKHAEATYAALPSEEHRRLARALFLRLIEPGLNEQDTTRRRAVLSELALPDAKQTALLWEVANAFVAARLITTNELAGTTTIEVSHEALIGAWPRLTEWLREGREDIHLQQAVSQDVEEWERRGKPKDRLYRGSQLREANAWAMRNLPSSNEAAFLQASTAYRSRSRVVVTAIVLLVLLLAIPAALLVRSFVLTNVVTTADDEGPGSLRQVIANARQGSIITFAANVKGPIILTGRDLVIDRSLTIRGPGTYPLAITGGKSGHRVSVSAGNTVTISDVSFINSLTDKVGWAFLENQGNLTLVNSTVAGNTSLGIGGGIMNNSNGRLTLLNSTVSGNSAKIGGGIYNLGILTISNSTISGNTASRVGGGIYDFGGQESITFCTLYGNTAPEGGGIFIEGKNNHVEMRASIIAGNHADTQPDIAGQLTLNGYNLIQNPAHATLVERGPISLDLIGVSPTVGPLQENGGPTKTHALLAGSPAIDRVPRDVCLATDQRGIKRPQGSACDIGAYE